MQYTGLGSSGLRVSRICLGCMTYGDPKWRPWIVDEEVAREHFRVAFDVGINFFDTADMYSKGRSEEVTGKLVREFACRHDVVLATKVYYRTAKGPNRSGLSRKHVLEACDASLQRLGTDFIDLYQIHRYDPQTPVEETLEALDSLVRSGKVRYLGASSMAAWQFAKALYLADRQGWQRFISMQNHYNLIYREEEREMIPLCLDQSVGVIPWSPLARGFLSGNRSRDQRQPTTRSASDDFADRMYYREHDFDVLDTLLDVSNKRRLPPAQVALAWLLSVPGVTSPIVGATRSEHIRQAAAALEVCLQPQEINQLESAYVPHPVLGHEQLRPVRDARED